MNQVYLSQSACWIVRREAIETVYELALRFWNKAKEAGLVVDVSAAPGLRDAAPVRRAGGASVAERTRTLGE